jgi:hypothetical protein
LIARCGAVIGQPGGVRAVPGWALAAVGLFSNEMRAIREMLYQYERPYVLDDSRFRTTFGISATPIDEAIRATFADAASTAKAA